jgi:hypothetical protein
MRLASRRSLFLSCAGLFGFVFCVLCFVFCFLFLFLFLCLIPYLRCALFLYTCLFSAQPPTYTLDEFDSLSEYLHLPKLETVIDGILRHQNTLAPKWLTQCIPTLPCSLSLCTSHLVSFTQSRYVSSPPHRRDTATPPPRNRHTPTFSSTLSPPPPLSISPLPPHFPPQVVPKRVPILHHNALSLVRRSFEHARPLPYLWKCCLPRHAVLSRRQRTR